MKNKFIKFASPPYNQRDQAVDKLSDFRSVFSGQHESGSSYSVGISNRKTNYTGTLEKSSVTDNSLVKPDALSRFDNLSTEARPESINIASIGFEQLGSDSANQSQADRNRHPVRSPHRRRSSSPTWQVQNGRTGSRRSNSVVIKSINYSQDWPHKDTGSNRELRSSDSDGAESDHAGNDPLESAQKPECTRRLSVQDAIHLFERKQNEMRRLGGEGIRKLGKVENRRFSSETGNSNEKLFLRRWSGASDTGMRISALKEATDDSQNQSTFVPSSGSKSEMKTSLSQSIGQSSQTVVDQGSVEETPQSEFRPLANANQGVEEKKDAGLTPLDHHNHKTDGLYLSSSNAQMPSTDQHLMPVVMQMNNARVSKKELTQTSFQKLQTAAFPVRQESKASYVSSHMRSRSSGCEPVTTFSLKTTQPKSSNKWREELGEKANQLEALFAAHKLRNQSQKAGNQEKMHVVQKEMSIGVGPDNLLTMPVQNIGRESLGSSWTNGVDSDIQALMNMIDVNHVNNCCKEELLCFVNDQEFRGKLYDQYNEKRDAKLRDEHTTKRAEKEAKIKAMQDVLEQRQAEMAATIATKNDPLGCSEDMPKDLPKPNGSRKFSSKTMPARSSLALTSSSPRTVLPGKVSSSNNLSSSSRCRSQPENPLAQSVPNFTDLKKENTKPSLEKGTLNSSVLGKGPKSQGGLKNNTKTVAGREPFLDTTTAGFGSIARIAKSKEEKKCLSQAALRKSAYAPLMGEVNAKVQKGTALEPNICSKLTNKSSPAPLEAKPFLRKGSGIGPGAGPGIAKLKQFLAAEDGLKSAEESQVNDQNVGETVEELVNISQLPSTHEGAEAEAAEAAEEENERYKLSSDDTERSDNQDDSETSQIDMQGDLASASVSPFEMPSSPVATNNGYYECNGTMACSAGPSMTATPSSCCITSLPRERATASFSSVSKSPSLHMSTLSDHVSSSAALAMELDSTLGGTASWNSHVQHPHAQMSEASEIDAGSRPRKKWAPAQKIVLATAPQQQHQKDPPKGLKRLLKFGRKSRGSEAATTDWVSASITSEGDDDTEEPRDLSGRSIDDLLRKARVQAKSFLPGQSAFDFQSLCENAEIEMLLEQGPTQSIRSSIPAPPANFKLREDHLTGGTMLKAPRPFFSLPSFRSKGSDSKPR